MANFDDLASIANNPGFQNRIKYAMAVAAVNVYAEAATTGNHTYRSRFATAVLNGNYNIQSVCYGVLSNSTIAAEAVIATTPDYAISDSDIQFAVNSIWSALAGGV